MKKVLLFATVAAATVTVIWAVPPLRRAATDAADRFTTAYHDRESALRRALMAESEPLAGGRHRAH